MSRRIRFEEISDPRDGGWRKAKEKNEAYIANLVVDSNERFLSITIHGLFS